MYIGQVNNKNYLEFSQLFSSFNKSKKTQGLAFPTGKTASQGLVSGKEWVNPYEDPYLDITGKSPSEYQKRIAVSDEVAEKLRSLTKEDYILRNGLCGDGKQADAQANIIKSYIAGLPGEQRLSAIYSCEQIARDEAERLTAKIKEHNPGWKPGQPFNTSILQENFSENGIDIRV